MVVHSPKGRPAIGPAPSQLTECSDSADTTTGFDRSSTGMATSGTESLSNPTFAVRTNCRGGLSSVNARARRAPTMSANCASMELAAVTKSGASEIAERSSASRSPLSCGLGAIAELSCCLAATPRVSRFESLKSPLQICIFYPHPLELFRPTRRKLAKWA